MWFTKLMGPDEAYKNKIGERLARRFAEAIKSGEISQEETGNIASYVLGNIDKARDNAELVDFLTDLSQKYPIFSNILAAEQIEGEKEKEQKAIEEASNLIKENKIDEAIKVPESATEQKKGEQT